MLLPKAVYCIKYNHCIRKINKRKDLKFDYFRYVTETFANVGRQTNSTIPEPVGE
jgi:hypothetical protein